ncbi:MAG: PTS sugar transporter subunit IIA [Acholeplasmataceae bacterium]
MSTFKYKHPFEGQCLDVTQTPDEVFSQKLLGPGFVYQPTSGFVIAPIDGMISMVFPTKHAISIKHTSGFEVLIHVGLDSVELKGEGFTHYVTLNQKVSIGDPILSFDLDLIKEKAITYSPVVFVQMQTLTQVSQADSKGISTYRLT